ncbi:hypothetical protein CLRAG_01130 [Clostridium ragsdalei P11]|uniref:Uncharacterized protein n=2 Tax=Clostridium ragsdalei TaxID=217158 RepID=A0A1A6B4C7_9CLOT|nr:hypothetical protein CLRAG_01130 [Clostridium ragsdalei P11]
MRKMDEMEMSISLKAIKFAWAYNIIFLAIWMVYNVIHGKEFGIISFLITTQTAILMAVEYFLKWKLGKDEK